MSLKHVCAAAAVFAGLTAGAVAQGCGEGAARIALDRLLRSGGGPVEHVWGRENMSFLPPEAGVSGAVLRVAYPAGSFSPGNSDARGGAGFEAPLWGPDVRRACLSYKVRFPAGFDFVKGGKLPGLYGGDNPRGCVEPGVSDGFSTRLMWRAGGAGELYLYAPGRDARCGLSIGRGAWTFARGVWTTVTQKLVMSSPGGSDGSVEIWIDGKRVVKADGLKMAESPSVTVQGVFFSTFFGGSDKSWASPTNQTADFADFAASASR